MTVNAGCLAASRSQDCPLGKDTIRAGILLSPLTEQAAGTGSCCPPTSGHRSPFLLE
jgi:hypothetical protein